MSTDNQSGFYVRVWKCDSKQSWYYTRIGSQFKVTENETFPDLFEVLNRKKSDGFFLNKNDCEVKSKTQQP